MADAGTDKREPGTIVGAYVSAQGLQNGANRRSLLSNPAFPKDVRPQLQPSLRRRVWLRDLGVLPNFLKRRFAAVSVGEERQISEQELLEKLTRYFGKDAAAPLDTFQQLIEFSWYLYRTLMVGLTVQPATLRDTKQLEALKREAKSMVTPEMRYMEACLTKAAENYREKYQNYYGKVCKPEHFAEKAVECLKKLPRPQALRTLQQQSRDAKRVRMKKKELLYQDSEVSPIEKEYQQCEVSLFEALLYLQLSVLSGIIPKQELLSFMDYFPPGNQAWFVIHDDKDHKIVQTLIDKNEFMEKRTNKTDAQGQQPQQKESA
jgi:hypothetical protein